VYNISMEKGRQKRGFTLIEVALFLAISGAMFAAVMYGISSSVARRRYNDSVNDIVEEIRNAYSATINVENYRQKTELASFFCSISSAFNNAGKAVPNSSTVTTTNNITDNNPGRTRCAYYGQVITFGETNDSKIHRYDLIGIALEENIEPEDKDDVIESIYRNAKADIVTIKNTDNTAVSCSASLAGTSSSFLPSWDARIENKNDRNLYHGAIMIARSPISGTIHTYFYNYYGDVAEPDGDGSLQDNPEIANGTFAVQDWLSNNTNVQNCDGFYQPNGYFVARAIREHRMARFTNLEICVGSEDLYAVGNQRRAIRIHGDGSTEASVELLSESESAAACKK